MRYTSVFQPFAAAGPLENVNVADGAQGRPLPTYRGPMKNVGEGNSCGQCCSDVIVLSQPWHDLFMKML